MGTSTRNGAPLRQLPDGAPRRMSDAMDAWRKMTTKQRADFLLRIHEDHHALDDLVADYPPFSEHDFCEAVATLKRWGGQ